MNVDVNVDVDSVDCGRVGVPAPCSMQHSFRSPDLRHSEWEAVFKHGSPSSGNSSFGPATSSLQKASDPKASW